MATVNTGGVTYTSSSKTPYVDIYNQWANNLQSQIDQHKADQQVQQKNDINKLNNAYNQNAKQYYLQNMQARKNLNSQLASQGINGGASESAMLRLNTAYGQNVAKNESGRQGDITSTNNTYLTNLNNYLAEQEANRSNMYTTMMQNQAEYEEKQRDRDLQNFAASITDRFNKKSGYQNLIKELQASDDPLKAEKIALVQQAMTRWVLNNSSGSGSGGSGYGGYGSSGGGGTSNTSSAVSKVGSAASSVANALSSVLKKNNSNANSKAKASSNKASGNYNYKYW